MVDRHTWKDPTPLVLDGPSLTASLELILNNHGAFSTLLVCSTRNIFLKSLYEAIPVDSAQDKPDAGSSTNPIDLATQQPDKEPGAIPPGAVEHHLVPTRTLHLLSTSRTIRAVFCPDVPHTLAYLAHLSLQDPPQRADTPSAPLPQLAIVNPLSQHRGTTSFSAQGLARFFTAAAHAAHVLGAKLVVAESAPPAPQPPRQGFDEDGDEDLFAPPDGPDLGGEVLESVWDEQVSLLNVTTKTFGVGDKGWKGRTVSLKQIAGRWCDFLNL